MSGTIEIQTKNQETMLFEIEDKGYIIFKLYMTIFILCFFLLLYAWNDFSLSNIMDDGRMGRLAVYISLPFFIYQLFFIIIYSFKKEKRKIKFYKSHILLGSLNYKIMINNIKNLYIIESNSSTGKVIGQNKFLILILAPLFLFSFFCSILTLYIITKKIKVDNFLFIMNNGDKLSSIAYNSLNETDRKKVKLYFEKYVNQNIDDLPRRLILIPNK